ncbi:hypothetical protein GGX14DRAFT_407507 [Mycena pura]|uniref:Uncharacterized protein n=1 Tax=Mycena pura TaxID=153505 RepID=A0AAD6US32_9AGAR|nr:hypothetical protein GGX14DRAFT_407507 [Mycena pura]
MVVKKLPDTSSVETLHGVTMAPQNDAVYSPRWRMSCRPALRAGEKNSMCPRYSPAVLLVAMLLTSAVLDPGRHWAQIQAVRQKMNTHKLKCLRREFPRERAALEREPAGSRDSQGERQEASDERQEASDKRREASGEQRKARNGKCAEEVTPSCASVRLNDKCNIMSLLRNSADIVPRKKEKTGSISERNPGLDGILVVEQYAVYSSRNIGPPPLQVAQTSSKRRDAAVEAEFSATGEPAYAAGASPHAHMFAGTSTQRANVYATAGMNVAIPLEALPEGVGRAWTCAVEWARVDAQVPGGTRGRQFLTKPPGAWRGVEHPGTYQSIPLLGAKQSRIGSTVWGVFPDLITPTQLALSESRATSAPSRAKVGWYKKTGTWPGPRLQLIAQRQRGRTSTKVRARRGTLSMQRVEAGNAASHGGDPVEPL